VTGAHGLDRFSVKTGSDDPLIGDKKTLPFEFSALEKAFEHGNDGAFWNT
jgi:hypothetical protein